MAAQVELEIDQGADFKRAIQLYDRNEMLMDITDASARIQFRRTAVSSIVLLEASTDNLKLTIDGANGIVNLLLSGQDTECLNVDCVHDCELTLDTGEKLRAFQGIAKVNPRVTR